MKGSLPVNAERILVIKRGALGDLIAGTAAIHAVRKHYPKASISLLSDKLAYEVCPPGSLVEEIIDYKSFKKLPGYWNLIRLLRSKKFDLCINLKWTSEFSAVLTFLSGSKATAGRAAKKWLSPYTFSSAFSGEVGDRHEYLLNLDIVQAIGISSEKPVTYIHQSKENKAWANDFIQTHQLKNILIVTPLASTPLKAWPLERFVEVSKKFIQETGNKIVVSYSPNDEKEATAFATAVGTNAILTPKTNIGQLAALVSRSTLCLCNNSGILHVAYASNVPVVCLNTSIGWAPYGTSDISITRLPDDPGNKSNRRLTNQEVQGLLSKISVDEVWHELIGKWKSLTEA